MEDDNTCNGDDGGNGFGAEDSQWTLQAVDNQNSNNSRRQFVGDFFKESRHLPRAARQAFCDEVARQADAFTSKWLSQAEGTPARYASEEARDFWKRKNAALGQNRAIAY